MFLSFNCLLFIFRSSFFLEYLPIDLCGLIMCLFYSPFTFCHFFRMQSYLAGNVLFLKKLGNRSSISLQPVWFFEKNLKIFFIYFYIVYINMKKFKK